MAARDFPWFDESGRPCQCGEERVLRMVARFFSVVIWYCPGIGWLGGLDRDRPATNCNEVRVPPISAF